MMMRVRVLKAIVVSFVVCATAASAQERGAGAGAGRGRGGGRGGRGATAPAAPSQPTPRWADGRVNLSQAPGVKGFWNVMGGNPFGPNALPGSPKSIDEVPLQDWARALYDYRQKRDGL